MNEDDLIQEWPVLKRRYSLYHLDEHLSQQNPKKKTLYH